jgi:hypothetical protein
MKERNAYEKLLKERLNRVKLAREKIIREREKSKEKVIAAKEKPKELVAPRTSTEVDRSKKIMFRSQSFKEPKTKPFQVKDEAKPRIIPRPVKKQEEECDCEECMFEREALAKVFKPKKSVIQKQPVYANENFFGAGPVNDEICDCDDCRREREAAAAAVSAAAVAINNPPPKAIKSNLKKSKSLNIRSFTPVMEPPPRFATRFNLNNQKAVEQAEECDCEQCRAEKLNQYVDI